MAIATKDVLIASTGEAVTSIAVCHLVSEYLCMDESRLLLRGRRAPWMSAAILVCQAIGRITSALPSLHVPVSLPVRLTLLTAFHTVACALETATFARRNEQPWRCREFALHLGRATLYVAPAWPLLVIAGSALLFITTAVFSRLLHLRSSLKWLVDLGSLHAPFLFVHMHTTRTMCHASGTLLPLRHGPTRARRGAPAANRDHDRDARDAHDGLGSTSRSREEPGRRQQQQQQQQCAPEDVRQHRLQHFHAVTPASEREWGRGLAQFGATKT